MVKIGHFNSGGQGDRVYSPDGKSVSLSANGGGGGAKTGLYCVAQRGRPNKDGINKQQLEASSDNKTNSLTSVAKDNYISNGANIRKLTPIECERLQGFRDNYTEGISNTQRYKALGNSFPVPVIEHILKVVLED